jgi:hypothetical protein
VQAAGQHLAQGTVLRQLGDGLLTGQAVVGDGDGFLQQLGRRHLGIAQGQEAFNDQGEGQNGAGNQGPDRPACGLYDREQGFFFPRDGAAAGHYGAVRHRPTRRSGAFCPRRFRLRAYSTKILWITLWGSNAPECLPQAM